jgi:hypothetical protein
MEADEGQPAGEAPAAALPAGWGPPVIAPDTPLLLACLAAAGARPLTILSPAWLTARFGPLHAAALLAPHRAPGRRLLVDAGDAPGHALAALAAGAEAVALDGRHPAWAAVARAAGPALLLPGPPPALDLAGVDLRRPAVRARLAKRLAAWFEGGPGDSGWRLG